MKRSLGFSIFLFLLASLTGYLLSKASLVGRVGISLFYQQYRFLKVWWQAGLFVLTVWLLLFYLQGWAQRKLSGKAPRLTSLTVILIGLIGLYFTYRDFRQNTAHRWLGERFHLGGYLFWVGCIFTGLFYLAQSRKPFAPVLVESNNPSL